METRKDTFVFIRDSDKQEFTVTSWGHWTTIRYKDTVYSVKWYGTDENGELYISTEGEKFIRQEY